MSYDQEYFNKSKYVAIRSLISCKSLGQGQTPSNSLVGRQKFFFNESAYMFYPTYITARTVKGNGGAQDPADIGVGGYLGVIYNFSIKIGYQAPSYNDLTHVKFTNAWLNHSWQFRYPSIYDPPTFEAGPQIIKNLDLNLSSLTFPIPLFKKVRAVPPQTFVWIDFTSNDTTNYDPSGDPYNLTFEFFTEGFFLHDTGIGEFYYQPVSTDTITVANYNKYVVPYF